MAMGTNVGLTKMAEATDGISYRQMSTASQWRLYEDSMNKAQATLVNYQHQLDLASYWEMVPLRLQMECACKLGFHLYMQTQIHITVQVKVLPFIDL